MQRFYIIADDLTGANDAGVQLSKIGISSTVFLDLQESSIQSTEDVAIIDTDSRALSEKAAYDRVYKASSIFQQQGFEHVYKKIDSTLRGNTAAELAAVVSVHRPDIVVIAPAYPKMNRQTVNGYQYVNGLLVSETEFGKDPKTPVNDSFIPNLFETVVDDPICLIDHSLLNSKENLREKIMDNMGSGTTWFICDAKTNEDLVLIAETFAKTNKTIVWAGSAGLIEYLPYALQLKRTRMTQQENPEITRSLTVSASLSKVTKSQLEMVRKMSDTYFIEVDPIELIKKTCSVQYIIDELEKQTDKKHFVLFVDGSAKNRNATKKFEEECSFSGTQISEAISKELGKIALEIVHSFTDINGLLLTGGDTAKAVCNQLNMNQMQLFSEVEVGLPLGKLKNETNPRSFWTVTKAGGFGNEHSLMNVLKYMSGKDE